MWKRRAKLKRLEQELEWINLFERLYDSLANPTEADQEAHITRQIKRTEVLAKIQKLGGLGG